MLAINCSLNIQVMGEPQILTSESKSVEAYGKIDVEIQPAGEKADFVNVEIQLGRGAQISFILIKQSAYVPNDTKLTYKVSNGAEKDSKESEENVLNEPHIYSTGMIKLLPDTPKILKLKNMHSENDTTKKVAIEILVGRNATPSPQSN